MSLAAPLLALSVRQPWAHAIIHGGKDVENRTRLFKHRGLTLIHASAAMTEAEFCDATDFMRGYSLDGPWSDSFDRTPETLERGGIVGAVDIVDSVDYHRSRWFVGPNALVLANPRPIPFIPCRGTVAPLFWTPPADVLKQARAALSLSD